jgi:hypothetical protein
MTLSAPRFALQSAQLTSRIHLQRPTNHALSTSNPLGPTCCRMALAYVGMPKNPALRPDNSLGDIVFTAPSCTQ